MESYSLQTWKYGNAGVLNFESAVTPLTSTVNTRTTSVEEEVAEAWGFGGYHVYIYVCIDMRNMLCMAPPDGHMFPQKSQLHQLRYWTLMTHDY